MANLESYVTEMRVVLGLQIEVLESVLGQLRDEAARTKDEDKVLSVALSLLQASGTSARTVVRLTETKDLSIRDCFGIARSIVELCINASYIAVAGAQAAEKANQHALQKTYRDLDRKANIGGTQFHVRSNFVPDPTGMADLSEALAAFTGRNGREVDWTPLSLSDRIEAVAAANSKAGLALAASVMAIYRSGSEFLHGTFYSVVYFWNSHKKSDDRTEDFISRWDEHFCSVFSGIYFGISASVRLLAAKYGLDQVASVNEQIGDYVLQATESLSKETS